MWLLTVASGVCVGVEDSGSSSHGDTVGEGSAFGVTKNGDSLCSIPLKRSKNSISSKYCNWFSHIGVTSQPYLYKFFKLVLIKLNYQSEEREARQDPYSYLNLRSNSNTSYSVLRLPLKVLKKIYWRNCKFFFTYNVIYTSPLIRIKNFFFVKYCNRITVKRFITMWLCIFNNKIILRVVIINFRMVPINVLSVGEFFRHPI